VANPGICSVAECGKPSVKRGLCGAHYKRLMRHGDPLAGARFRERQPDRCGVKGCDRAAVTLGLCGSHYARQRKTGDAGEAITRLPTQGQCQVEGCGHVGALKAGMCTAHHHRLRRYGDPHVRKAEANGALMKWVKAHVDHAGDACLPWPFPSSSEGRGKVVVDGRPMVASRYMCILAHGDPPSPTHEAAHSCGKGHEGCMNPRHLRWATRSENQADKVLHGTAYRGERHWAARLTEADVRSIRSLLGTMTQTAIADAYGVDQSAISDIKRGRIWAWLK